MINYFFNHTAKLGFYISLLILFTVLPATNLMALSINTLDSDEASAYIEQERQNSTYFQKVVQKDPEHFLKTMKDDLVSGNLDGIGKIAEPLITALPENPDVRSLYSIFLVSSGKLVRAQKQLEKSRQLQKTNLYALYAEAMLEHRQKNYSTAETICSQAIARDRNHPYPRNILGRIYFDQKKYDKAYSSFKKAIELAPKFVPGYTNLGATSFMMGNNEKAISYFQKAVKLKQNSFGAHYGLAVTAQAVNDNTLALHEYLKSYKLNPNNLTLLEKIGKLQLEQGRYREARETGQTMLRNGVQGAYEIMAYAALQTGNVDTAMIELKKAPAESLSAAYTRGYCLIVKGQYEQAFNEMDKIYKQDNSHAGAYATRACLLLYLNKNIDIKTDLKNQLNQGAGKLLNFITGCTLGSNGKWREATDEFNKATDFMDAFTFAGVDQIMLSRGVKQDEFKYIALGVLLHIRTLENSALAELNRALKINNDSILANYWTAQIYLKQGKRQEAMATFKKSTKLAPTFFSSLYILGELNFVNGNTAAAARYYEAALAVGENTGLLIKLGVYYEHENNDEKAAGYYERAIKSDPENFIAYNQLAWLYAKRGVNTDKALRLALKADTLQPGNAGIMDTIGWLYYHQKQDKKALTYLNKAHKVAAENPTILYHLGAVYKRMGDQEQAEKYLNKALKISDKFTEAAAARKLLQ